MATKREAKPPAITKAMAKAFCEAGMPTTAVELERVWRGRGLTSGASIQEL